MVDTRNLNEEQEFSDADFRIVAKADQSKKLAFDISGLTTATTRTITIPDHDVPLADFVGDSGSGGVRGLVPAPAAGDNAAGKFLKAGGGWAVPAYPATGGMTLLGTLTTSSGSTVALTGLTLTSYRALFLDVKNVATSGGSAVTIALGSGGTPTYGTGGAISTTGAVNLGGGVWIYGINLTSQRQTLVPATVSGSSIFTTAAKCATGTAAVANAIEITSSGFTGGSADVYGVN